MEGPVLYDEAGDIVAILSVDVYVEVDPATGYDIQFVTKVQLHGGRTLRCNDEVIWWIVEGSSGFHSSERIEYIAD